MKLILRYLKNLGVRTGLFLFFTVEVLKKPEFQMAGYSGSIYLRPSTSDVAVFREVFLFKIYSFKLKAAPKVIVDAGANIGLSSIFFANRFPSAAVYAIEPEATNFASLQRNVATYTTIQTLQTAVWPRDTALRIVDPDENHWAFAVRECDPGDEGSFQAISITSFMHRHGIKEIDLLKMDVEGAEREIFSGDCDYWLSRTRVLIIELHDWMKPGCSSALFSAVARYNIKTTAHEGMLLIEFNP